MKYIAVIAALLIGAEVSTKVWGPLAIVFLLIAAGISVWKFKVVKSRANKLEKILYAIVSVSIIISMFYPIWNNHPAFLIDEHGNGIVKHHSHHIWETGHIH